MGGGGVIYFYSCVSWLFLCFFFPAKISTFCVSFPRCVVSVLAVLINAFIATYATTIFPLLMYIFPIGYKSAQQIPEQAGEIERLVCRISFASTAHGTSYDSYFMA